MNTESVNARLALYLARLRELPFVLDASISIPTSVPGWDAELVITTPTGSERFLAELKDTPVRKHIAYVSAHQFRGVPPLAAIVFSPYIDPPSRSKFKQSNISYSDLQGNLRVSIGDRYVADVEKPGAPPKATQARALRAPAYRVLFALLAEPNAVQSTTRELAALAGGVSPQTAADVRATLLERGMLLGRNRSVMWPPGGWKRAHELWLHGFSTALASTLQLGTFRAKNRDVAALEANLAPALDRVGPWLWGGGAASDRLTGYFRGDRTVLYLEKATSTIGAQLGLLPDARGNVVIAQAPGPLAFYDRERHIAHPLLAHADLLDENDERAKDAAKELYDRYLAPLDALSCNST
jgi:hypothetical protein